MLINLRRTTNGFFGVSLIETFPISLSFVVYFTGPHTGDLEGPVIPPCNGHQEFPLGPRQNLVEQKSCAVDRCPNCIVPLEV